MYEGVPNSPDGTVALLGRRGTSSVRGHHLYTAPTLIRTFMNGGRGPLATTCRLRLQRRRTDQPGGLALVPEVIGGERLPIVDTWWQTGDRRHPDGPRSPASPPPSRVRRRTAARYQRQHRRRQRELALSVPASRAIWSSTSRGGDAARHLGRPGPLQIETYWSRFAEQGWYFAGDGAADDADALGARPRRRRDERVRTPHLHPRSSRRWSAFGGGLRSAVIGAADETTRRASSRSSSCAKEENTGEQLIAELRGAGVDRDRPSQAARDQRRS